MLIVPEPVSDRATTSKLDTVALNAVLALNESLYAKADVIVIVSPVPAPASTVPPVPWASVIVTVSLPAPIVIPVVLPPTVIESLPAPPSKSTPSASAPAKTTPAELVLVIAVVVVIV